jgi:hypothetical protein
MSNAADRQLRSALLESIKARVSDDGFVHHKPTHSFRRQRGAAVDKFQLVCLDAKPGWLIQPNVGVRIESVEAIFHQTSGFEAKYQGDTPTIGTWVGYLPKHDLPASGTYLFEVPVKSHADLPGASTHILRIFRDIALPYFEKYHSLGAIDLELNSSPRERTGNRGVPWLRCSTGAIVAKLVGRPDYRSLVDNYTEILKEANGGFYLPPFAALLKSLESVQPAAPDARRNKH